MLTMSPLTPKAAMYPKTSLPRRDILSRGVWLQLGLFPSIDSHGRQSFSPVVVQPLAAKRVHESGFLNAVAHCRFDHKVGQKENDGKRRDARQRSEDEKPLKGGWKCEVHGSIVRGAA